MSAGKFRKKPVAIDAVQWTGANINEVLPFFGDISKLPNTGAYINPGVGHCVPEGTLDIPTLEGVMTARPGDWIIKGVKGEFYPCKPDIFAETYENENAAASERDALAARCEKLTAALKSAHAAMWDAHYGRGITTGYAQAVDEEIRTALALLEPKQEKAT